MKRGRFITVEGGEGAGKSTQIARLARALKSAGKRVIVTREPGGTPAAEAIRALLVRGARNRWRPLTEALLHFAARHEHVERVVRPALSKGAWVISDRFADSTMAYQGYGHRLGVEPVTALVELVAPDLLPDLTLILDLPPKRGLARAKRRRAGEERYEKMGGAFHARVRKGFLAIAKADPERCVVIDSSRPLDEVSRLMIEAAMRRLKVKL